MTWVRLADDFSDHPKIVRAGPLAAWLYVCGLTYANRYATDGFLPSEQIRRLADVSEPERLARRLVESHLWEEVEGGYSIHDYAAYQPTADEVKQERADAARRQAEYRKRRAEARNAARNGESHAESNALLTRESQPSRATGAPAPGPARPGPVNTPGPGSTTPLPPPPAEGERKPTRRRSTVDDAIRVEDVVDAPPLEGRGPANIGYADIAPLSPLAPADCQLWRSALEQLPSMTPGNREQVNQLEPLGRAPDGGLRLRAPPGHRLGRFRPQIARALADAGDAHGTHVQIIER